MHHKRRQQGKGISNMAKLISDNLVLEIKFVDYNDGWVEYEIAFLWQDEPIINDSLLKRVTSYWQRRSPGTFKANQFLEDDLVQTLEKALERGEASYWEPLDPDITIGIYPDQDFPFLCFSQDKHISPERNEAGSLGNQGEGDVENNDEEDISGFTLIVAVDLYNFRGSRAYYGEYVALIMTTTRQDLERFTKELREEYLSFKERYGIDAYRVRKGL